jgi:hypothetical protein
MKLKLWVAALVLMSIITGMSFNHEWCYTFRIDKTGSLVADVDLETRNNGLTGFHVNYIDADPKQDGYVVISNDNFAYVSTDNGASWRRVNRYNNDRYIYEFLWVDKILVGSSCSALSYSIDFGRNWLPLKLEIKDDFDFLHLIRDSQGRSWVHRFKRSGENYYRIEKTDTGLKLLPENSSEIKNAVATAKIQVKGGELTARVVSAPGGLWAATNRGPFFHAAGALSWDDRSGNLGLPTIEEIVPSPVEPDACLARGDGGQVWTTKDRGKHWDLIPVGNASKATYLTDGTLMVAQSDNKILLFRGLDSLDISPPNNYFRNRAERMIEEKSNTNSNGKYHSYNSRPFNPEEFTFHAIGGMAQQQWIVAGDTYLYYPGHEVDQSFSTTFSTACMVSEKECSRFVLFVHTQDAGWKTKSIDELPQYESASKMSCSLSVDEHHDLFINDEKIPTPLLHGIVERAGWLQDASLYYAMSDWHVQVGQVHNCRLEGLARSWALDGISVDTSSRVFEIQDGFEVLTPDYRGGVETFRIDLENPPLWRWLLQRLSFGTSSAVAWVLLFIWTLMLRRAWISQRPDANNAKG